MTPEKSAARGEKVVRISYHRRMYGLGEVGFKFTFSYHTDDSALQ